MNIFLCRYNSTSWKYSLFTFHSLKFPTSVSISSGSNFGLGFQILLDTNLQDSINISKNIINKFSEKPCIVISKVVVNVKNKPIGEYNDHSLIKSGRYFGKLVSEGYKGIFVK